MSEDTDPEVPEQEETGHDEDEDVEVEGDEVEYEADLTRAEIADHFEAFAEGLRGDGAFDVDVGETTVTLDPPETVEFEFEIEDEGELIGDDVEREVEFELEWMTREGESELPSE